MDKICGIYKITSPSNKIYIGQSRNFQKRLNQYLKKSCKNQIRLYNSFLKYGVENHTFEFIEKCIIEELNCKERYWQDFYDVLGKNGLNCKLTNSKDKSGKLSNETILKMSNSLKGKIVTQEQKESISKALKGKKKKPLTKEHKEKISIKNKGRKPPFLSKEAKQKIGDAHRGKKRPKHLVEQLAIFKRGKKDSFETVEKRKNSIQLFLKNNPEQRKKSAQKIVKNILQYDKSMNFIKEWECIQDIKRALNLSSSSISQCCNNKKYKSVGGFIWKFK